MLPAHVLEPPPPNAPVHANVAPPFGETVRSPTALLSNATLHVVVHGFGLGAGEFGLTFENVTWPVPVPANVIVRFLFAATYGPTSGPPDPTGAAPAGVIDSVDVSPIARARFSRPFPV